MRWRNHEFMNRKLHALVFCFIMIAVLYPPSWACDPSRLDDILRATCTGAFANLFFE